MEKSSFSLLKLAIFFALLACVNVPTFGASNGGIRMPQKAKIIVEELAVKEPESMSAGVEIEMVQLQPKFMEIGQQVPTFGVSNGGIRMPRKAKIIVEELVAKKPEPMSGGMEIEMVQLQPKFMEIGQQGKVLQCVGAGSYCNIVFGPQCCTTIACIPPGIVGGVCVA